MLADTAKFADLVYRTKLVVTGHVLFQMELAERAILPYLPVAHHRRKSPLSASMTPLNQLPSNRSTPDIFKTIWQ